MPSLTFASNRRATWLRFFSLGLLTGLLCLTGGAAETKKSFDLPAGTAGETLKGFAKQAGREIVFSAEAVSGTTTNAVQGELTPREAIETMLADTGLVATQDAKTGAFAVRKGNGAEVKNGPSRTPAASSAEVSGSNVVLDKFTVTGSRITRLQEEGAQPVVNYSGEDIEERGFTSTGEFMQSLPFNSGSMGTIIQPTNFSTGYVRGASTINPRGLGPTRFLVLLDGRRLPSYGLSDNGGASVFDFNSIPTEAIKNIEFLKDGASAIYGADAISGVMNIKLKTAYEGLSSNVMVGNTLGHDTFTRSGSILAGGRGAKTSYLLNVNYYAQNSNMIGDYDRSKSTDYSALGAPRGNNNNSLDNFPFNIQLTAAQASAAGFTSGAGLYVLTGGQPVATMPALSQFSRPATVSNANRYDFAPTSQLVPDQENLSMLTSLRHEFADNLTGFAQVLFTDNITDMVFTPNSIRSRNITTAAGQLSIPANSPYNPFGFALNDFRGRALFGPTRTFHLESTGGNLLAGLEGKLPGDWTWTGAFSHGYSLVNQKADGQIRASDLQAALNGTLTGYNGVFLNPFGPSTNAAMVNSLFVPSNTQSRSTATSADLSATGSLFEMPALFGQPSAGKAAMAVGVEARRDKIVNDADATTYLVPPASLPFRGSREVQSAYVEFVVPVLPKLLELQVAGRFDHYSDFGDTTNPKIAIVSQPASFLKLRASYSKSFKAPELGQLFGAPFSGRTGNIVDPLRPADPQTTYATIAGGNPNLGPEEGRVWFGGVVVDLGKVVKGLSFSVDYFDIEITDVITTFPQASTLFTSFPERVIRDNTGGFPGLITAFDVRPVNAAAFNWRGADLGINYQLPTADYGRFRFDAQATYIDTISTTSLPGAAPDNTAGRYNNPRLTGTAQLGWKRGKLAGSLTYLYKGSFLNDVPNRRAFTPSAIWDESAQSLINASFTFPAPFVTSVTVGCNNVFDTQPPEDGFAWDQPSNGFDSNTYAAWSLGRFVYLKVRKEF